MIGPGDEIGDCSTESAARPRRLAWAYRSIRWRCIAIIRKTTWAYRGIRWRCIAIIRKICWGVGGRPDLSLAGVAAGPGLRSVAIVSLARRFDGSGILAGSSSVNDLAKRLIIRSASWREPRFRGKIPTELNAALDVE